MFVKAIEHREKALAGDGEDTIAPLHHELIDKEARVGIRDSRVAFLHPRSTGGVLTEIVQPASPGEGASQSVSSEPSEGNATEEEGAR